MLINLHCIDTSMQIHLKCDEKMHSILTEKCRFLCVSPHSQKQKLLSYNLKFILFAIEMRDSSRFV